MIEEGINFLSQDNNFKKVIESVGECKIGKNTQTLFAYLIGLIIGQKISFSNARKIRSNLYTETSYNFTPQDIKSLSIKQWTKIGASQMAIERIMNTTQYFIDNNEPVEFTKKFILGLLNIDGIGIWTIETLMIEYGIDYDLFPILDKHVNGQLEILFDVKQKNISEYIQKFAPYRSIAFWYLWKYNLKK